MSGVRSSVRPHRDEIDRHPEIERRLQYGRHLSWGWTEIERNDRRRALRYGWEATKNRPSPASLAICCFAVLGTSALDVVRSARDAISHTQFDRANDRRLAE